MKQSRPITPRTLVKMLLDQEYSQFSFESRGAQQKVPVVLRYRLRGRSYSRQLAAEHAHHFWTAVHATALPIRQDVLASATGGWGQPLFVCYAPTLVEQQHLGRTCPWQRYVRMQRLLAKPTTPHHE